MEYRRFGRTELQIPVVTFGGGWVGGVLIHQDEETAFTALDLAANAGIDWIDTAALYGNGTSEVVIGRWLSGRSGSGHPRLSTKFRVDPSEPDLQGQMRRSIEASLNRLGLERVELVILHNTIGAAAQFGSSTLDVVTALQMADAMESLKDDGLCNHLGMTALGDPTDLHQTVATGRFDVAQVYYNMLNPTSAAGRKPWNSTNFDGLLTACTRQDMGVMGIRIFAGGHLASAERHGREIPITLDAENAAEERRAAAIWQVLAEGDGTPAQAALRFGLASADLSTVVVGLGELDHLQQVVDGEAMGPLPANRLAAISPVWDRPEFTG
ncbi:MAG: aldo/keto reductase [Pseudomonadota bacterium]